MTKPATASCQISSFTAIEEISCLDCALLLLGANPDMPKLFTWP